jgi:hypothetical protein
VTPVSALVRGRQREPSNRDAVRVHYRTLILLALCAAAAAAALAHYAIDVVGDFALRHDTYDGLAHGSREYAAALAAFFAVLSAARGLRVCCELAQRARGRIAKPEITRASAASFAILTMVATGAFVPAMEWLDDAFAGLPLAQLDDAFGGSLLLGLATTLVCAAVVAAILYAVARWLLAHRDFIVAIVATLLQPCNDIAAAFCADLDIHRLHRQMPSAAALCLAKRGPPVAFPTR